MSPDIEWITPLFDFNSDCEYIAVPENGRRRLQEMADKLVGTSGLVAIYIPEGTADIYNVEGKRGRVVGAVELQQMPSGKRMEDYFYKDWDESLRWPIGWPCRVVYAPNEAECPFLREQVELIHPGYLFGSYVTRFQQGPFKLDHKMQSQLANIFTKLQ